MTIVQSIGVGVAVVVFTALLFLSFLVPYFITAAALHLFLPIDIAGMVGIVVGSIGLVAFLDYFH